MLEILASAAFGYLKGRAVRQPRHRRSRSGGRPGFDAGTHVVAPVVEEVIYRKGLAGLSPGFSAAAFAVDHLIGQRVGNPVLRAADVFAGGLLYSSAYRRFGLFGAIAAHCMHNVACTLGRR